MPVHVRYTSSIPPYIYVILREEPNGPHSLNNSSSNKTVFHLLENDFIRCSSCQSRRLPLNVKKNGKFMGISFSSLMTGLKEKGSVCNHIPQIREGRSGGMTQHGEFINSEGRELQSAESTCSGTVEVSGTGQSYSRTEEINNAFANEVSWDRSSMSSTQAPTHRPSKRTYGAIQTVNFLCLSWRKLAGMNVPRREFAFAVVGGLLYVIRGFSSDGECLQSSEVYDPETNHWSLMDDCPDRPDFHRAFAFSFKSKLFVVGNESRFIDIYDPRTETWEELDSGQSLSVYSYTVVRNKVYFFDHNSDYKKPELGVFDPEENSWSSVSVPRCPGAYWCKVGEWNNKVILVSPLGGRTLIRDLDKENASKWRDTHIKPSGSNPTISKSWRSSKMETSQSSLIPGLTDDVAELCLSRIPHSGFRIIAQVCRRWRAFLRSEHFSAVRKLTGSVEEFTCVLMESQFVRDGRFVKYLFGEVFDVSGNCLGRIPTFPGPFVSGFGVAVLRGRKIVFFGGYTRDERFAIKGTTIYASAHVHEFDPATNSWRKLANMNVPRHNFAYAVVNGLLYVIRGFSSFGDSLLSTEVYNPKTNQWSLMDCPYRPVWRGFAFSFKSKLFVVSNESRFIDIYDPKTETWKELDSGQSLSVYSYTVIRNKVYFFDRKMPGLGVFDPEENSWSWVGVPRSPGGYWFRLGEWNNKVILIARLGGCKALTGDLDKDNASKWRATHIKPSGSNATVVCRGWRMFIKSKHFADVRKLTGPVEEFMCVIMDGRFIRDGRFVRYVYGEVFDASGNNLGQIPRVPGPFKNGFGVAVLGGGKIVIVGGYAEVEGFPIDGNRISASADVYEFDPASNSWRNLAPMNIPRHNFAYTVVNGLLYVIRGFSSFGDNLLSSEVYNPETKKWSLMDCPHRSNFRCTFAFSFNSKLYVVGGNKS
ncbi:hypothetical protein IGI04_032003 [Brassica rapa subsp. trilocularis]|uniref:F-box domain-containing protein n=1 Tax=Brassica rapa subsp. trilocularis TaxID=1813537 RepID=A0ABQ7LVY2_BRACM|nr:hypothetical protein IGI04_032003 [Brassica rapa subsp. trilocularis]